MKQAFKHYKQRLPKFNDYLLTKFKQVQLDKILPCLDTMWKEIVELANDPDYQYYEPGYRIVPPLERARRMLSGDRSNSDYDRGYTISSDHLVSVEFMFRYKDKEIPIVICIPYLFEDRLVVKNNRHLLEFILSEKIFFKIKNGINIKIKMPINFRSSETCRIFTAEEGYNIFMTITNVHIYNLNKSSRSNPETIMHYFLAKYGFEGTLQLFQLTENDICITQQIIEDINYVHFKIYSKTSSDYPDIFLRVSRKKLGDYHFKKIVANILEVFNLAKVKYKYEYLVGTDSSYTYKWFLGKLICAEGTRTDLIQNHIETHFELMDSYINHSSKIKLAPLGVKTIWELLLYVFNNIDNIVNYTKSNDLLKKKLTAADNLLENLFIIPIYRTVFPALSRKDRESKQYGRFRPISIKKIYTLDNIKNATDGSKNDNCIFTLLKTRDNLAYKPEAVLRTKVFHFHPSFVVVKNLNHYATSNPAQNAILNPFLEVDENGNIKPDEEIAKILQPLESFIS